MTPYAGPRAVWDPNNENICLTCDKQHEGMVTIRGVGEDDPRPLGLFICKECALLVVEFARERGDCGSCGVSDRMVHPLYKGAWRSNRDGGSHAICSPCAHHARNAARAAA